MGLRTRLCMMWLWLLAKAMLQDEELYAAVVIATPGMTSPAYPIPTMNWTDWPEKGPGLLTAFGMRQEYLLGKELRAKYRQLAKNKTLLTNVHVRVINSTDSISSAQAFLQGFVFINTKKLSSKELPLSLPPIPIHEHILTTIKNNVLPYGLYTFPYDMFYPSKQDSFNLESCPHAQRLAQVSFNRSRVARALAKTYEPMFYSAIRDAYKLRKADWPYPIYLPLLDSIVSVSHQWQSTWLSPNVSELLTQFANKMAVHVSYSSKEANKLLASPVLRHVESYFNRTLNALLEKSETPKGDVLEIVHTAREIVGSLLAHMGMDMVSQVSEASTLCFELRGPSELENVTREDFNVRSFYNNRELQFESCSYPACNYAEFYDLVEDKSYDNYQERCHRQGEDDSPSSSVA